ncbi:hypothetical protein [Streptomyces lasiicapitis]|uniref:hypothetical protein n=1 Tax=Streptomyces lasiicapitis TaxID=1923961 RepID=UPI0016699AEE|nr:hypothetical protein [Streptomyces lasiicapitis]
MHQGVVTDVREDGVSGTVELTLTRYDGSTRLLRPIGQFTVTDEDDGHIVYSPARHAARTLPLTFIEAARLLAPEQWKAMDELLQHTPADRLPPEGALALATLAAQMWWECTSDEDTLDDERSPAARYARAAAYVWQAWAADADLGDRPTPR